VYLSEAEKQQILASLGRPGWQINSSAALPISRCRRTWVSPALTSKGTYTVTVVDPANPQGGGDKITIRKGAPSEGGGTTWIAESPAPKSDTKKLTPSDAVHVAGRGYYLPDDPNNLQGKWSQVVPDNAPNADDEVIKAVDRQGREASATSASQRRARATSRPSNCPP
jgi:hypothetical protein